MDEPTREDVLPAAEVTARIAAWKAENPPSDKRVGPIRTETGDWYARLEAKLAAMQEQLDEIERRATAFAARINERFRAIEAEVRARHNGQPKARAK